MKKRITLLVVCLVWAVMLDAQVVKVACVGNSITFGAGIANKEKMSYPGQLQGWLGSKYLVKNFGVSGCTILRKGDKPYWNEPAYQDVLNFKPDIIIVKLGTNDSKPQNWQYSADFEKDYTDMVNAFKALSPKPRVLLAFPAPVAVPEKWGIRDSIIRDCIIPIIKKISKTTHCQYIDLYTPLLSYKWAFPDQVHPNSIGASVMVEQIYRALFQRSYLNTALLPAPGAECRGAAAGWGEGKDWYGQFENITKIGQEEHPDLILLGNSITQNWGDSRRQVNSAAPEIWDSLLKPLRAANFGISGDRTQHILWRIQNGNLDQQQPKVIALEIGVNNFPYNDAKEIASGIESIVKVLQKKVPMAKILLFGPLPTGHNNMEANRQKYYQIHQAIKKLGNGKTIIYENMDPLFINPDGTIKEALVSQDAIHLTKEGYRVWASVLVPDAKKLMSK